MDELIEILVRALISLFASKPNKPQPPPLPQQQQQRDLTSGGPMYAQLPAAQQQMQRQVHRDPQRRTTLIKKLAPLRRLPQKQIQRKPVVPPPSKRIAPPALPEIISHAGETTANSINTVQHEAQSITGAAIRQLIQSRPNALRTMWVLSEVLQPPITLRDHDARLR
jgi:hypothetical protein